MEKTAVESRYLIITGGIGGAKLALGLAHILDPDEVLFAVNIRKASGCHEGCRGPAVLSRRGIR